VGHPTLRPLVKPLQANSSCECVSLTPSVLLNFITTNVVAH